MVTVERYGRHWAVYLDGALVCVTVYKKGALQVARLLEEARDGRQEPCP